MEGTAPPFYGSLYDENEIVGLFTEIYQTLVRQGYITDSEMNWPPPEGRNIPLDCLVDPGRLDERVVSLMKKLPIGPELEILPRMRPSYYMNANELRRSRDIDRRPADWQTLSRDGVELNAAPTVLLLLEQWEGTDPLLVLDVADSANAL